MPISRVELLKLKLDLVYRGADRATIQTQFQEKTNPGGAGAGAGAAPPK